MAHGDERGLKLPPKIAPIQVRIIPIAMHKEGVLEKAEELRKMLEKDFRVDLDSREQFSPGYKFNDCELKGIPIRLDIENGECILVRRDTAEKVTVKLENLNQEIKNMLEDIHNNMFKLCKDRLDEKTHIAKNLDEFETIINTDQGYIKAMWCGNQECEDKIKELTGAHSRCIPFQEEHVSDTCVCCGKPAKHFVIWGRQY